MHQYAGFSVILAARFIVIMFRINLAPRLCLSSSRGRWIWVESFVGKGKGTLGTGRGRCATIERAQRFAHIETAAQAAFRQRYSQRFRQRYRQR